MTHIPDLLPCNYFDLPLPDPDRLVAVGWLHPNYEYSRGDVARDFFDALFRLLSDPWQPVSFPGFHACEFCTFSGGPRTLELGTIGEVPIGWANLFVPANGCIYAAPSTIIHYIDAHQYRPPLEFQKAVMDCPRMRSIEYLKAIIANGPRELASLGKCSRVGRESKQ